MDHCTRGQARKGCAAEMLRCTILHPYTISLVIVNVVDIAMFICSCTSMEAMALLHKQMNKPGHKLLKPIELKKSQEEAIRHMYIDLPVAMVMNSRLE